MRHRVAKTTVQPRRDGAVRCNRLLVANTQGWFRQTIDESIHMLKIPRLPRLVEPRIKRAVEAEEDEQPLPEMVLIQFFSFPSGASGPK